MKKIENVTHATMSLSETDAAELCWQYYKTHKAELSPDIRRFRDVIIAELMGGSPVEQVFARFRETPGQPEPVQRKQRAIKSRG